MDSLLTILYERLVTSVISRIENRKSITDDWLQREALSICAGDAELASAILREYEEDNKEG